MSAVLCLHSALRCEGLLSQETKLLLEELWQYPVLGDCLGTPGSPNFQEKNFKLAPARGARVNAEHRGVFLRRPGRSEP